MVVCLCGRLVWEFYDELERRCTETIELSPNGYVVAAMSNIVRREFIHWKSLAINDKNGAYSYSMCDLQLDLTSDLVSRNVQTPEYQI